MSSQNPNTDDMQDRVDELGEEIDEAQKQAEEPKVDLPEVQQDRSLIDPDGHGDPDGPTNAMPG